MNYGNWLVLGNDFGWQNGICNTLNWIYWAPGKKTQEGSLSFAELGIQTQIVGSLHRSAEDLHEEVLEKGLPLMEAEVKRRTTPRQDDVLSAELKERLGSNYDSAMLWSKTWLKGEPYNLINGFRHLCTNYDSTLAKGADRYTANLRAANTLLEILHVYKIFRGRILDCPRNGSVLEPHIALANLPHDLLKRHTIELLKARRLEAGIK